MLKLKVDRAKHLSQSDPFISTPLKSQTKASFSVDFLVFFFVARLIQTTKTTSQAQVAIATSTATTTNDGPKH